jgi:RNA polymerase sigma-70 factor (ECF subfamily)
MASDYGDRRLEPPDGELVSRAQAGDREAMGELLQRYERRILSVLVGMVRNPEDAREILQETFVRAFRNLEGFKGESSFYTWIYRIAMNLAIDHQRRGHKRPTTEFDETIGVEEDAVGAGSAGLGIDPFKNLRSRELGTRIFEAIESLTPDHRAVILLREIDGLSYEEISEVLQCELGTVMSRLHYARKKLQTRLQEML